MSEHLTSPDVYVHVPKAAGTSLNSRLIQTHGAKNAYAYDDRTDKLYRADRRVMKRENTSGRLDKLIQLTPPAAVRLAVRFWENAATSDDKAFQRAAVIFGHFAVDRFDDVEDASDASYRVVVREPLDRMVSHYRFSQQQRGYAPALRGWMSGQDIDLAFPDFALDASVHNFQTRYTGTDPNRYDLIGTVDRLPAFLATAGLIESGSVVPFKNKTKWEGRPADPILNDPGFQRDFQAAHAADYEFYQAALDRQSVL